MIQSISIFIPISRGRQSMAANMQKIKLLKLYELLRKETDVDHPISRVELCRRLNVISPTNMLKQYKEHIRSITAD